MPRFAPSLRPIVATLGCLLGLLASSVYAADLDTTPGLRADPVSPRWSRLQARLGLGTESIWSPSARLSPLSALPFDRSGGLRIRSVNVLGDFYFRSTGGFRATGGVLSGSRDIPWTALPGIAGSGLGVMAVDRRLAPGFLPGSPGYEGLDGGTVPYLGLGYSDAALSGSWGFSADVGLMALGARSAVRLGPLFGVQGSFDDYLRQLRLAPTVQVGVSYSF